MQNRIANSITLKIQAYTGIDESLQYHIWSRFWYKSCAILIDWIAWICRIIFQKSEKLTIFALSRLARNFIWKNQLQSKTFFHTGLSSNIIRMGKIQIHRNKAKVEDANFCRRFMSPIKKVIFHQKKAIFGVVKLSRSCSNKKWRFALTEFNLLKDSSSVLSRLFKFKLCYYYSQIEICWQCS